MASVHSDTASDPQLQEPVDDAPMIAVFIPALLLVVEIHDYEGRADVHLHAGGQGY